MKKHSFLFALLTAASPAAAQVAAPAAVRPAAPDPMVERRVQYLTKELGLNPDQQAKLQPLLLNQRQQMQAMREQRTTGGRRLGVGLDVKAAQARFDEQLKAIFTPEQFTKFNQMQAEQREKMREHRAQGPAAAPPTE